MPELPGAARWLWLSLAVIVLDRISKWQVTASLDLHERIALLPGLNLVLAHNTGAAFSLLRDAGGWQRWFFVLLGLAISVVLVVWLLRLPRTARWLACTLALILGGALGNLWDRLQWGHVIDFVDVYVAGWHWPAFNVADSAITIGAVMLIIDSFRKTQP
jgi:signal peptidase II